MLPCVETDTETAVPIPEVVARVLVDVARDVERDTVVEHIAEQVFVCLFRHNHKPVVGRLPAVEDDERPIPVLRVDVVVVAADRALGADDFLHHVFELRAIAGNDHDVGDVLHDLAVFVLEVAHLVGEDAESLFERSCGIGDRAVVVVAVSEDISITTSSVNDRDYDASAPYYYIVFEGKNGQMTYVSAALSDFDTEFSSVTASLSAGESGAVLTVAGTAKNAGYVAAAHSASGELVLGGEACDAGEFSVTCDLSQMTEPGIWYDVRLYNLYTGQRFDLASSCAQTSGEIEVGDRIYSFQVYDDLLKVTYSEKRGDASDVIGDLTMTLTAEDGTPYLTISGTAEEGIALSAAICTDNAQVVSAQNAGTGGTVSIRIDLSALTIAGRWYDLIITADGAEYDVYSSSASLNGQIYANGHIYNFQDWEGVVKVACDPT